MSNFFLAPRSRPVLYTPNYSLNDLKDLNTTRSNWRSILNTTKRIVEDNLPVYSTITNRLKQIFSFPGVQTVSWEYKRDISEQYGLKSFNLVPWFTKAISVKIKGKYYIGAFAQDTVVDAVNKFIGVESLISWIRDELRRVDELIIQGYADKNNSILSSLRYGADADPDGIELLGFIRNFSVEEDINSPYVQSYVLDYIGVDKLWYAKEFGKSKVKKDYAIIDNTKSVITSLTA